MLSALSRPAAAILIGEPLPDAGPDEQDTIVQAEAVAMGLRDLGYNPRIATLGLDLDGARRRLEALRPALVFNLVESVRGQGRLIHLAPSLLDLLGLRYTGSATEAIFLTSHKPSAKARLAASGVATPRWQAPAEAGLRSPDFPGPWIVKSAWEHASIGLDAGAIVTDPVELTQAVRTRKERFGGEWFVEAFVDGREFNVAMLAAPDGPQVLPLAEIAFRDFPPGKPRIVDYAAKWQPLSFEYRNTVRSFVVSPEDASLALRLQAAALQCWSLFGLRGYARVDFRVDAAGRPFVLEVNANPCIAPDAGFMAAATMAGLDFQSVLGRIAADANPAVPRASGLRRQAARGAAMLSVPPRRRAIRRIR